MKGTEIWDPEIEGGGGKEDPEQVSLLKPENSRNTIITWNREIL